MRKLLLPLLFGIIPSIVFSQNTGSISGKIIDKQTNEALRGATVAIKGTQASMVTNNEGYFKFQKVNVGKIILVITYVGYEAIELTAIITEGQPNVANAALSIDERIGNAVVVSASRRPEKITDAPASIQVIGKKELEQFTGSNTFELLSKVPGVEFTRTGVDHASINARGLNNAFNGKVFQMMDGRNSMTPLSGSLPMHNNSSIVKDDIERIEVVLGPQTALYGPNAHNAIINFITKDPRTSQGTSVAISAGNQHQFSARVRQATKINRRWAYKLAGEYAVGEEFPFYDSVYAGGGVNGPTVAIPERGMDFNFRHIRGEAHVYYGVSPKADIIISTGGSQNNATNTHTGGHNLFRGISNSFLQARYVSPRFYVNLYNAWADFGTSFNVGGYTRDYWNFTHRNINRLSPEEAEKAAMRPVHETPQRLNAEAQYNYKFEKAKLFLVTGFSYQKDKPRAYGITLVDSAERIYVTQVGAVLQLEKSLPWDLRFIGAGRWDNHSNFGNFFSPKLGLVKRMGNGNARITWGRAYSMPSVLYQYAKNGNFYGNGRGIRYIPNDTKMSDSIRNVTISLKPEEVNTWELGYKGTIAKNLYIDINCFNGLSKNFFTPSIGVLGRALYVGDIPVKHPLSSAGKIDTAGILRDAQFTAIFNFGDVKVYGIDAGLTYTFNKFIRLSLNYSWLGSDIDEGHADNDANKDSVVSADERSLNSPAHRGLVSLNFQNLFKQKMYINVSARFVQQYDFYSGSQISTAAGEGSHGFVLVKDGKPVNKNFDWGPLGGFTTFDFSTGYKINEMISAGMSITNLFDTEQREYAGSSLIGRLIMFELKVHIPNGSK
jgi:outer membrane receptor for ferrienterochelin and colicins